MFSFSFNVAPGQVMKPQGASPFSPFNTSASETKVQQPDARSSRQLFTHSSLQSMRIYEKTFVYILRIVLSTVEFISPFNFIFVRRYHVTDPL